MRPSRSSSEARFALEDRATVDLLFDAQHAQAAGAAGTVAEHDQVVDVGAAEAEEIAVAREVSRARSSSLGTPGAAVVSAPALLWIDVTPPVSCDNLISSAGVNGRRCAIALPTPIACAFAAAWPDSRAPGRAASARAKES